MGQVIYKGESTGGVVVFDPDSGRFVFCPKGQAVTLADDLEAALLAQGDDWDQAGDGAPVYVVPTPPILGPVVVNKRDAVDGRIVVVDSTERTGYALRAPEGGLPPFSRPGALSPSPGAARWYARRDVTLASVRGSLGAVSEGLPVIVDVNVDGASIFADPADRLSIPAGEFLAEVELPAPVTVPAGSYVTVDVDQVGVAVPEFVGPMSTGNDVYSGTNISLPKPTGSQVGDLIFATVEHSVAAASLTPPAGWTQIGSAASTGGTGGPKNMSRFFWVDDGSPGPFVFVASASVNWGKPRGYAYRNVLGEIDDSSVSPSGFDNKFNGPALTLTAASDLILLWGNSAQSPGVITPPSGFTQRGSYVFDSVAPNAGVFDAVQTTNANSSDNVAGLVAFKPDPAKAVPGSDLTVDFGVA